MIKVKVKSKGLTMQVINQIRNPEPYLKAVAIEMMPIVANRIHEEGKATDGNPIGTYSKEYMKVRTGNYGNAERYKKGNKRGKLKNSGYYTKTSVQIAADKKAFLDISKEKIARPKYNRNNDTKVIASLTRQLENDYGVVATPNGWAIGFNTKLSFDKARWVENTYKKKIWSFTNQESEMAKEKIKRELQKISSGINT